MQNKITIFCLISLCVMPSFAEIPYCNGTSISEVENALIQPLVANFGKTMGCQIGNACLRKWDVTQNHEKFSIAWYRQCGPRINGVYQLGDNGFGSTFVCEINPDKKVCCWPLGYDYNPNFVVCE